MDDAFSLPPYNGYTHNAMACHTELGKVFIVSTTDIKAGSEIFYPYGK